MADYYELNARNLITTWGGSLNDYASRTWSGLVSNYYTYRWNLYFDAVIDAIEHNKSFDQGQLDRQIKTFEDSWVKSTAYIKTNQKGDLQEFVSLLIKKYEK